MSDLILNINVYMADVAAGKLAFVHSVDLRGDTDKSLNPGADPYLVKNYLWRANEERTCAPGGVKQVP